MFCITMTAKLALHTRGTRTKLAHYCWIVVVETFVSAVQFLPCCHAPQSTMPVNPLLMWFKSDYVTVREKRLVVFCCFFLRKIFLEIYILPCFPSLPSWFLSVNLNVLMYVFVWHRKGRHIWWGQSMDVHTKLKQFIVMWWRISGCCKKLLLQWVHTPPHSGPENHEASDCKDE